MNLFDITKGIETDCGEKSRPANSGEIKAYCNWLIDRSGLPRISDKIEPQFRHEGRGAKLRKICVGATIGAYTGPSWGNRDYEAGSYSVIMPGAASHKDTIIFEQLNDAGEVVTSSTMPLEPKKGGIVWARDQVRRAAGPVAKPDKPKAKRSTVAQERKKRERAVLLARELGQRAQHYYANWKEEARRCAVAEARATEMENENRQLWAEIEALTRPIAA